MTLTYHTTLLFKNVTMGQTLLTFVGILCIYNVLNVNRSNFAIDCHYYIYFYIEDKIHVRHFITHFLP